MKFRFLLVAFFALVLNSVDTYAQLTEGFESGLPTAYTATTSYTLGSGTWTGQANGVIRGTTGVNSGSYSLQLRSQTGAQITTPNITSGAGVVTFWGSASTTSGAVQVNYSTDGGFTWTPATGSPFTLTTGSPVQKTATINNASSNILVQFYRTGATVYIDDVNISTYTPGITTAQDGPWNVGSTWTGGIVPTSAQNAVVNHNVTLDASVTRDAGTITTISASGKVATGAFTYTNNGTTNVSGTFELNSGGFAGGSNLAYTSTGILNFNTGGTYNVNNTHIYWPAGAGRPKFVNIATGTSVVMASNAYRVIDAGGILSIAGSLTLTTNPTITINGTLRLDAGGFINTGAMPIYGSGATLLYNTGGTYGRGYEWNAAGVGTVGTTAGYPYSVQLSSNTTLDYINGAASGAVGSKAMGGNLTIDAGSALHMNYGSVSAGGELVVAGNISNAGTLTLGFANGDDLRVTGNLTNTGTFNGNSRAVYFNKAGTQVVTSAAGITIPYLRTAGGGTTVQFASGTNAVISAPLAGNAIVFGNAADVIDINGTTLTIGTAAVANTISGTGTFKGSTTSNLTLLGTGSIGTISFTTGSQNLGTLVMNRQAGQTGCVMGTAVTVNTALTLTAGIIDLNNTTMTLAAGVNPTGSANSYVIADVSAGGVLRKNITATGSQSFPIGSGGTEYSPVAVSITSATIAGGSYIGMSVENSKDPLLDATSVYLNRYWILTSSGISLTAVNNNFFVGTYLAADVVGGTIGNNSNQHNGTTWLNNGAGIAGTVIINGTTLSGTDHYTAGRRDPEINIVQSATNYLNGSTYNFGTVLTGSTLDVVFTIQNLGQQTLVLSGNTLTGNPPYSVQGAFPVSVSGISGSTPGTQTFTIRFAPTAPGTFTGNISIANNDPSGSENPYVIYFTGVGQTPAPEINIRAASGGFGSITSGNITTTNGLQNTAFGNVNLGSNVTKDFEIQNLGTAVLTLSGAPLVSIGGTNPGDFVVTTVPATSSIAVSSSTTFIITFTPQAAGARSAIVSIANNDSDENPYTYLIDGTGVCLATGNTLTPTSGPVGTEVTVTATTNNLTGAIVVLGGANATPVTQVSSTQIKVTVPSGAINGTGTLVTTNAQGCQASTSFTVIGNTTSSCQGGTNASDLFISEVTDATYGGLTYVEIYNGTGASVNLGTYSLQFFANGSATSYDSAALSGTLANGATYVVATSLSGFSCSVTGGDGTLANLQTTVSGINFDASGDVTNGHDHIALYKSATKIDSWGTYMNQSWATSLGIGDRGVDFRRKNTAVVPNTTFSIADWDIIDWIGTGTGSCSTNDYSNIGVYNFLAGTPPTVTLHPSYTPTCKATSLTVSGTEGFVGGNALAYQWYAVAPNTAAWTALTDGGLYSGVTTATLNISDISTLVGYQFYCQIRENTVTCYSATNAVMISPTITTTWQASNTWSSGVPTLDTAVIIDNTYDTTNAFSPSFEACRVTVNTTKNVTVRANDYILIKNELTVSGTGTATFENNSSLVQINNVVNSGNITYKRIAQQRRLDYVYWSAPVDNYLLSTLPSNGYKLTWNTTVNNANGTQGNWQFYSGTMNAGKGYIVSGPSTFNNTANQDLEVPFYGVPRNGDISVGISRGSYQGPNYNLSTGALVTNLDDNWNLLGNPYPSSMSCRDFLTANSSVLTGALYIWTHGTLPSTSTMDPFYQDFFSNYDPNADYLPFNLSGNLANPNPDYYIGAGQGFFVIMQDGVAGSGTVNFTNALRNKTYGNATGSNFFRMANTEAQDTQSAPYNRIWLDIVKEGQRSVRTMFGYIDGATMGKDNLFDAITKTDNTLKLYTVVNEDDFVIQGRSLPFDEYDQVPLGVDIIESGTYKIAIGMVDGLFENAEQKIYLEDTYLNIIHSLREAPYQFTSVPGIYNDRFKIRYTTDDALGNHDLESLENSVIVTSNHGEVGVKSPLENITEVTVFDILGRQLFHSKAINSNDFATDGISLSKQSVIIKIRLENGTQLTRKIIIN